jgi:hypothetical protein
LGFIGAKEKGFGSASVTGMVFIQMGCTVEDFLHYGPTTNKMSEWLV